MFVSHCHQQWSQNKGKSWKNAKWSKNSLKISINKRQARILKNLFILLKVILVRVNKVENFHFMKYFLSDLLKWLTSCLRKLFSSSSERISTAPRKVLLHSRSNSPSISPSIKASWWSDAPAFLARFTAPFKGDWTRLNTFHFEMRRSNLPTIIWTEFCPSVAVSGGSIASHKCCHWIVITKVMSAKNYSGFYLYFRILNTLLTYYPFSTC